MKFLVTAALTDQAVLDKLADWMREQQAGRRIMAAYGLVGRRLARSWMSPAPWSCTS